MSTLKDLTGQTFGRLYVVGRARDRVSPKGYKTVMWACICSCGGERSVKVASAQSLVSGLTKSCGCHKGDLSRDRAFVDLTGQRFGRLVVQGIGRRLDRRKTKWLCKCDCGNTTEVRGDSLRAGSVVSCKCWHKEVVSEMLTGENCPWWKGGCRPINKQVRCSPEYTQWQESVFERDNYTCQYSGSKGLLSCHHIKPFYLILEENNINTMEEALACNELWDITNGVTLLFKYHSQTSKNPKAFHKIYGTTTTEEQFYEWFANRQVVS